MREVSQDSKSLYLDELRAMIRDRGLKATHSRMEVIELLRKEERALTFKQVADLLKDKSVDQSTIFRALKDLAGVELLIAQQNELGFTTYVVPDAGSRA